MIVYAIVPRTQDNKVCGSTVLLVRVKNERRYNSSGACLRRLYQLGQHQHHHHLHDLQRRQHRQHQQYQQTTDTEGNTKLHLTEPIAWLGLSIATAICLISGGISFSYVPSSHRNTFYQQKTLKQHLTTYWWNDKTWGLDHHNREVDTQEAVRALLVSSCLFITFQRKN